MTAMRMRRIWALVLAGSAGIGLAACHPGAGQGLHESLHGGLHGGRDGGAHKVAQAAGSSAGGGQTTLQLQGNDAAAWAADPNMQAFFAATRKAFADGPDKVDVAAYEARAKAIFDAFAASRGVDAAAMQDHLKAIPLQMVQIVRDDPEVLDSFDNFRVALFGPD